MALGYWLKRPSLIVPRLQFWVWERMNPDKPWLCPETVAFCEATLSRSMTAVEFGSGRSTRWLSTLVGHLTSVEHDPVWYAQVKRQLDNASVTNVWYRLVPLNHPESEPERAEYSPTPEYVALTDDFTDRSLGFAVVDGHYRTHCVRHLIPKMAPGGFLLVDDVNMWPSIESLPIPRNWRVADDSTNGIKRSVVWQAA